MNKTAIKNYAIWARVNLIEAVKQRAYQYEITKDSITDSNADVVSGKPLSKDEKDQRKQLITQINQKGFDQVMEEVAYTWFNRFIALRFMEVNGYLPTKVRVFTDAEGAFKPEILKEALTVDLKVDKDRVMELLEKQDNEELYKMLLIAQCNELSNSLPDMFEVISNYTELLFPNNLLKEDSVLGQMVTAIPEEDWTDAVQIIGWLYQYYNSELKDETFALLKKNVKISKERIPAATQLFTPDWIVRYMVENSLGRLWYEGHPNEEIKKNWKYYLDEAEQEPEVEEQLKKLREEYKTIKPEDIKVIDPCMGSGHILVYAFDVLMQIYTSAGWSERDAAESILKNNLYGLDIDDRAGQLAYFAVMMKARKYNRRILTLNIRPKVYSIQESNNVTISNWNRLGEEASIARKLIDDLTDAKEYGSILNLSVTMEELKALRARLDDIDKMSDYGNVLDVIESDEITRQLYPLVDLAEVMVQKYDVVVTNPPYMGGGNMSGRLSSYVKEYYPDSKADLFAVFIDRGDRFINLGGYQAMITQHVWMFISSYEQLRDKLLMVDIINMAHLGPRAFDEISGEVVQTTAFVLRKRSVDNYRSIYCRLIDPTTECGKEELFLSGDNRFITTKERFNRMPGSPIAYWISDAFISAFSHSLISELSVIKQGLATCNNNLFLRDWFEINYDKIGFGFESNDETIKSDKKWFPYNKGGGFRKWFGNNYDLVNWKHGGVDIHNYNKIPLDYQSAPVRAKNYYFKSGITYGLIASTGFSARDISGGFVFDVGGSMLFPPQERKKYIFGLLNSVICQECLHAINPTLNYQVGDIGKIPVIWDEEYKYTIEKCVDASILISKVDWNSYESSWDFKKNPLI